MAICNTRHQTPGSRQRQREPRQPSRLAGRIRLRERRGQHADSTPGHLSGGCTSGLACSCPRGTPARLNRRGCRLGRGGGAGAAVARRTNYSSYPGRRRRPRLRRGAPAATSVLGVHPGELSVYACSTHRRTRKKTADIVLRLCIRWFKESSRDRLKRVPTTCTTTYK